MTVRELFKEGTALVPALDASLLLAKAMNTTRKNLLINSNEEVSKKNCRFYYKFLKRRMSGECTAYILGQKEFMGLNFNVNKNILVPRPETEILVETALAYIDGQSETNFTLLDLCTGSGAIAISIKKIKPLIKITASDKSKKALNIAKTNAIKLLGNEDDILFIQSDLFVKVSGKFNLIVSNPPYIPSDVIPTLSPEVRNEPRAALDGGDDGLFLIKKIIKLAPYYLAKQGGLILEADPGQMKEIKNLMIKNDFTDIKIQQDLAGDERIILGVRNLL